MEIINGIGVYSFAYPSRMYGALFTIRGRVHVFGASRRGFFWRIGARIYSPARGRFDSVFGLRTQIAGIDLMFKKWLKDETLPLRFRRNWIRGTVSFSRSGLVSFQLYANDPDVFAEIDRRNWKISSASEIEDASYYQSYNQESDRLDCD